MTTRAGRKTSRGALLGLLAGVLAACSQSPRAYPFLPDGGATGGGGNYVPPCGGVTDQCCDGGTCTPGLFCVVDNAGPFCDQPVWAFWPMPNSPASGLPNPASYDTSTPGVVRDKVSGLEWQRGVGPKLPVSDADVYCRNLTLDGKHDWRLPSEIELYSLLELERTGPTIDTAAFPNTPAENIWSDTDDKGGPYAWCVDFYDGTMRVNLADEAAPERCVRGGSQPSGPRYTVSAGTVHDNYTKLTWQQGHSPGPLALDAARSYCQSLSLDGGGFRLPSEKELLTLVDFTFAGSNIGFTTDLSTFPDTPKEGFISSTPAGYDPSEVWGLDPLNGDASTYLQTTVYLYARCVR